MQKSNHAHRRLYDSYQDRGSLDLKPSARYTLGGFRLSQLRVNMASGFVSSVSGALVLAFTYPICLRYLGYEQYGLWLLMATVLTFSQLGNLGIAQAVTKQVSEAHGNNDIRAVRECATTAIMTLFATGSMVAIIITVFRHLIVSYFGLNAQNEAAATNLLPYIALFSMYVFVVDAFNSVLGGLGRMDLCNYTQAGSQILAALTSVLLLRAGYGMAGLLASNVLAYLLLHVVSSLMLRSLLKAGVFHPSLFSVGRFRSLVGFGTSIMGGSVLAMLLNPLNKFVLARYAGLASVPVYDLAFTGSMRLRNLFDSAQKAIVPEVSRLQHASPEEARKRARTIIKKALRYTTLFFPFYLGAALLARPLLQIWLKSKFDPSSPLAVQIILAGTFLSLLGMASYYVLIGFGRGRGILLASGIQFATNLLYIASSGIYSGQITVITVLVGTSLGMGASSLYLVRKVYVLTRQELVMTDIIRLSH